MNTPTNTEELRKHLAKILTDCDDPRKVASCAVKTAAAGKIISAIALDLQHMHMRKEFPSHPWCLIGTQPEKIASKPKNLA